MIFKRCGCRSPEGKRLEKSCPKLGERGHGSWYFHCYAPNLLGRAERIRRGGFASQAAARAARNEWLATTEARRTAGGWTVERWLRHWLDARTGIRPTTGWNRHHLEAVLARYVTHYNNARPHRGIGLEVPVPAAEDATADVQPIRRIERSDVFGGLIHEYRHVA